MYFFKVPASFKKQNWYSCMRNDSEGMSHLVYVIFISIPICWQKKKQSEMETFPDQKEISILVTWQ